MAVVKALRAGNWNDTSMWSTGLLPQNGDTVYLNSFNVLVNQAITIGDVNNVTVNAGSFVIGQYYKISTVGSTNFTSIGAASNTIGVVFLATGVGSGTGNASTVATITNLALASVTAAAGGTLTMDTGFNIWAWLRSGTTVLLNINMLTSCTILGGVFSGGTSNAHCVRNLASGTVTFVGELFFANTTNMACYAISNESTGTLNITGVADYVGNGNLATFGACISNASSGVINFTGIVYSANVGGMGIRNGGSGVVNFTGTAIGRTGANGNNATLCNTTASGTINFIGTHTGGTGGVGLGWTGINNNGICNAVGDFYAGDLGASVVQNASTGTLTLRGNTYDNADGTVAVYSPKTITGSTPVNSTIREALSGGGFVNFYTADYSAFGHAPVSSVRTNVSYASGSLIGTMNVPSPSAVSWGIAVDNTVGVALLNPASIWSFPISSINIPNTIGARLSAAATTSDLSATNVLIDQKFANIPTIYQLGQLLADALNP